METCQACVAGRSKMNRSQLLDALTNRLHVARLQIFPMKHLRQLAAREGITSRGIRRKADLIAAMVQRQRQHTKPTRSNHR